MFRMFLSFLVLFVSSGLSFAQFPIEESFRSTSVTNNWTFGKLGSFDPILTVNGGIDSDGNGALRLNSGAGQLGYAYLNQNFALSNGISLEFNFDSYTSAFQGADGFAIIFYDSEDVTFQPGDGGSNFGYRGTASGNFFLGVGISGSYSSNDFTGGPSRIAVRSDKNFVVSSLATYVATSQLEFPSTSSRPSDISPSNQRRIRVTLTPDDSLLIDLKYGQNDFTRVISLNNISNSLVANPDSFRIAILGSAGGAGSIKEIRDLIIERALNTVTGGATLVTESSARLNGGVYAIEDNTTATFYYGTESGNLTSSTAANLSPVDSGYYTVFADLADLTDDMQYYYQIESVNTTETLTGSERSFATLPEEPLSQPVAGTDSSEAQSIYFTWTPVEGTETIILVSDNIEAMGAPVDGVSYIGESNFQNAPQLGDMRVVYAGSGDSVAVTGLTSETSYYFFLFSYSPGSYSNPNYLTTAPTFEEVITAQLPFGEYYSDFNNSIRNAKIADMNGDGLSDVVSIGYDIYVHYNNGEGFNEPASFDFSDGGYYPSLEIADFNQDGANDIFFVMQNTSGILMSGEGLNYEYSETFPSSYASMSAVLDFNKDGLPDLLLGNESTGNFKLYLNTNPGFEEIDLGIPAKFFGSIGVADFNKDGYDDFAYSGSSGTNGDGPLGRDAAIYINNGGNGFTRNSTTLPGGHQADLKILDYNNDTWPDFIYSGSTGGGGRIINLVINNQDGTFTQETEENYGGGGGEEYSFSNATSATISLPPPSAAVGLAIADYNNDGYDDIFIAGTPEGYYDSQGSVWINNGESGFSEYISGSFAILIENRAMAADFNNDGKADFIVSGYSDDVGENGFALYKNNLEVLNVAPGEPTELSSLVEDNQAELSWSAPTDDLTTSLRYSVLVGTEMSEGEVIPSVVMSGTTEYINAGYNTDFIINNLAPGTYYWQVQAVDGGFAYSDRSVATSFEVTTPLPIPAPTGLTLSLEEGNIVASWNPVEVDTLKYYFVYFGTDPEVLARVDTTTEDDPYDVSAIFSEVNAGTSYYIAVSSVDTNDTEGPLSFVRSIFIAPFALDYYSYFSNYRESMVAADFNQDGLMDILTTGEGGGGWALTDKDGKENKTEEISTQSLNILINTSQEPESEFFSEISTSFSSAEAVAVADFTGDTKPDIIVAGDGYLYLLVNQIGNEEEPFSTQLISESYFENGYPDIVTGDFDNNMRMDFAIVSNGNCAVFYQTDYLMFSEQSLPVESIDDGSISAADFDLDGDLDLLITGQIYSEGGGPAFAMSAVIPTGVVTLLFENVGGETGWEYLEGTGLPGAYRGGAEFADFTGDGYPDVVLSGRGEEDQSRNFGVFKNNGDKTFSQIPVPGAGLATGNIQTGDLNNDGLIDFVLLGAYISQQYYSMNAYLNNGDETFTALDSTTFNPVYQGNLVLGDLDGDSDLDIVVTGSFSDGSGGGERLLAASGDQQKTELSELDGDYLAVYINNYWNDLSDPMPPTDVLVSADYSTLSVSFNAGSDEETPTEALTYNIRVISADSSEYFETFGVGSDSESGASFLAQAGMVGINKSWSFDNVPDGNYYVAVQTVDASFRTSTFTDDIFVTVNQTVPVELSAFTAAVKDQSVNLFWATTTEKENAGFGIERKSTEKDSKWMDIGFVEGKGTTSEPQSYSFADQPGAGSFTYRLRQTDLDGSVHFSQVVEVTVEKPLEYALNQNYPNPFNPVTRISYSVKVDGQVQLFLYDILGRQVRELVNEVKPAGSYTIDLDASGLSSGVYFYRIHAGDFSKVMKMTLLK